jgi:hypothetical protein
MICLLRKDKKLCVPAGCTATSFFGLAAAINQKAAAHPGSKLQGITCKIKRERVTRRAALALRGLMRVFGRFAPQHAMELQS